MKKLLLLPTLLLAINLSAATETTQDDAPITEQTETTVTKTDQKTSSFWVRHANKLKNVSYGYDTIFAASTLALAYLLYGQSITYLDSDEFITSMLTMISTGIIKVGLDPLTTHAMNKKITHLEQKLKDAQNDIDVTSETTNTTTHPSFFIRHTNKLKYAPYINDLLICLSSALWFSLSNKKHARTTSGIIHALFIAKTFLNPISKYALSSKIAYLEEELQRTIKPETKKANAA